MTAFQQSDQNRKARPGLFLQSVNAQSFTIKKEILSSYSGRCSGPHGPLLIIDRTIVLPTRRAYTGGSLAQLHTSIPGILISAYGLAHQRNNEDVKEGPVVRSPWYWFQLSHHVHQGFGEGSMNNGAHESELPVHASCNFRPYVTALEHGDQSLIELP